MAETQVTQAVVPNQELGRLVEKECGADVNLCFQCRKCAVGCPVAYAMDYQPPQLIHAIRLGMDDLVLNSKTIWMCASCETCNTRCPQDVDIPKVMDAAKVLAIERGIKPKVPSVRSFHKAALANLKKFGRMYELWLIMSLKMRTGHLLKDMGLGTKMVRKGKLKLMPSWRGVWRFRRINKRVKKMRKREAQET